MELGHSDLKPVRIFLTRSETDEIPKVLDFGTARFPSPATLEGTARCSDCTAAYLTYSG